MLMLLLGCALRDPPIRPYYAIPAAPARREPLADETAVEALVAELPGMEGLRVYWKADRLLPLAADPVHFVPPVPPDRARRLAALQRDLGLDAGILPTDADEYAGWMLGADLGAALRQMARKEGFSYAFGSAGTMKLLARLEIEYLRWLSAHGRIPPEWVAGYLAVQARIAAGLPKVVDPERVAASDLDWYLGGDLRADAAALREILALRAACTAEVSTATGGLAGAFAETGERENARMQEVAKQSAEMLHGRVVGREAGAPPLDVGASWLEEGRAWRVVGTCPQDVPVQAVLMGTDLGFYLAEVAAVPPASRAAADGWIARKAAENLSETFRFAADASGTVWIVKQGTVAEGGWMYAEVGVEHEVCALAEKAVDARASLSAALGAK